NTFFIWGVVFLILVTGAAQFYSNPPKGWLPVGFTPKAGAGTSDAESYTFATALKTRQWYILWLMLFLNISAGIGLISQLSPMAQDVLKRSFADVDAIKLAAMGGTILAIASIFNGLGRLFWAWVSDGIGRKMVFTIMFITQAVLYVLLPSVASYILFAIMACYMLACYGGGFATMPAFAADTFGPKFIGRIYGTMLTAWGAAGVIGPLVFARIKEMTGTFRGALFFAAALLIIGFLLSVTYKKPKARTA
ncbi:MFS transporter, partial [candidate division KSB1 bacterium]